MKNSIKKIVFILFLLFLFISVGDAKVKIYFFHSNTCPHCKHEKEFLSSLDNVDVEYYEVSEHKNSKLLERISIEMDIPSSNVPLTIIGSDYVVGYSEDTKNIIQDMIESYSDKDYCDAVDLVSNRKYDESCARQNEGIYKKKENRQINIFGHEFKFNAKDVSLPLISILIGFIDGFNPCAMWVLIFLISMLINLKDRKKMIILGLTFLVSSALVYLVFMLGLLKVANSVGNAFKYVIGTVAFIGGIINLRSYYKSRKSDVGCQVTDKNKRKKISNRIIEILSNNKFIVSIIGIVFLAISVNFIELACSAGLPTMFIEILSLNDLSRFQYYIYILIYILMFMIDDIAIFLISVTTLKATGISNKYTKYSHLIGGIIMLLIGILMIFKTEWLMFNF